MRRQPVPHSLERVASLGASLEACRRARFDVILFDLSLPGTTRFEGLHRIRKFFPDLPIIILTGLDDPAVAATAKQAGAQDYLVKDLDMGELLQAIRTAISRSPGHFAGDQIEVEVVDP